MKIPLETPFISVKRDECLSVMEDNEYYKRLVANTTKENILLGLKSVKSQIYHYIYNLECDTFPIGIREEFCNAIRKITCNFLTHIEDHGITKFSEDYKHLHSEIKRVFMEIRFEIMKRSFPEIELSQLNIEQKDIVMGNEKYVSVEGVPGSGKTRTLTTYLAYKILIGEVHPENIIAVTFTKKAALEMQDRLAHMLKNYVSENQLKKMYICTFHSFCCKMLREYKWVDNFSIYEDKDCYKVLEEIYREKYHKYEIKNLCENFERRFYTSMKIENYNSTHFSKVIEEVDNNKNGAQQLGNMFVQELKNVKSIDCNKHINEIFSSLAYKDTKQYKECTQFLRDVFWEKLEIFAVDFFLDFYNEHGTFTCLSDIDPFCDCWDFIVSKRKCFVDTFLQSAYSGFLYKIASFGLESDAEKFSNYAKLSFKEITRLKLNCISHTEYEKKQKENSSKDLWVVNYFSPEIYSQYEMQMQKNNALDFADLILKFWQIICIQDDFRSILQNRFPFIMVDEFQDTNKLQMEVLKTFVENPKEQTFFVSGDADQSIYSFRGAQPENLVEIEKNFPSICKKFLRNNYRNPPEIVDKSNNLIKNNVRRTKGKYIIGKKGFPQNGAYNVYRCNDEHAEARAIVEHVKDLVKKGVKYSDIAIMFRTKFIGGLIKSILQKENIPVVPWDGNTIADNFSVKGILAYFKVLINPKDNLACERALTHPPRGIGKKTLEKIKTIADENSISLYSLLENIVNYDNNKFFQANNSLFDDVQDEFTTIGKICCDLNLRKSALHGIKSFIESMKTLEKKRSIVDMAEVILKEYKAKRWKKIKEYELQCIGILYENIKTYEQEYEENEEPFSKNDCIRDYLDNSILSDKDENDKIGVILSTMHRMKGLEFLHAVLAGVENKIIPHAKGNTEEERNLMYVALTRAIESFTAFYSVSRNDKYSDKSLFLDEVT